MGLVLAVERGKAISSQVNGCVVSSENIDLYEKKMYFCGVEYFKNIIMTVVSTKEFASNQEKYFDLAMTEEIFVKRDNMMFLVTTVNDTKKKYLEPDDDLRRAITADEFLEKALVIVDKLDKIYLNK